MLPSSPDISTIVDLFLGCREAPYYCIEHFAFVRGVTIVIWQWPLLVIFSITWPIQYIFEIRAFREMRRGAPKKNEKFGKWSAPLSRVKELSISFCLDSLYWCFACSFTCFYKKVLFSLVSSSWYFALFATLRFVFRRKLRLVSRSEIFPHKNAKLTL